MLARRKSTAREGFALEFQVEAAFRSRGVYECVA